MAGRKSPIPQIEAWAADNRTCAVIILESEKHPDSLEMRWARMIEAKSAAERKK